MAKCLSCGRRLTSEESLACGIGSECRNKARKAGTLSKRGNSWRRRVERTIGFTLGEFQIGNTIYKTIDREKTLWSDGKHEYDAQILHDWLWKESQIIDEWDVTDKMFVLLQSGKSIEEIMRIALDKVDEL